MKILGMTAADQVPPVYPSNKTDQGVFLRKLATRIVDTVFLPLQGVDRVVQLSGEGKTSTDFCLCFGGTSMHARNSTVLLAVQYWTGASICIFCFQMEMEQ